MKRSLFFVIIGMVSVGCYMILSAAMPEKPRVAIEYPAVIDSK
jgi:hypothetical protein